MTQGVQVFIDTGAFYAREDPRDQEHTAALRIWREIEVAGWGLVTTSLVLAETVTLVGGRLGIARGHRIGQALLTSGVLEIVRPGANLELHALSLWRRRGDPSLSFADALSLHVVRARKIDKVFSFDQHLRAVGAEMLSG